MGGRHSRTYNKAFPDSQQIRPVAEFPILTLRKTNLTAAVDELLWIWQKKSNNIKDLNSKIWDSWADEEGSIGKAYGISSESSINIRKAGSTRWTGYSTTLSITPKAGV
jgi:thymidylate synthase